jgi:hypothetical protein
MGASEFGGLEFLRRLGIEERVERLAPVSPPGAILNETEVPIHVNAAA